MTPLGNVPCIHACVLSLNPNGSLRCLRVDNLNTEKVYERVGQSDTAADLWPTKLT